MNITIKDVAKLANVSIATVSRVLNQSKPVSSEVREKVLQAIEELGFNPNPVARSLVMKESLLIGVLIPDISNVFFSVFVRGIEQECFTSRYTTLLCNTNVDTERELHYLNLLKDKYVDGVILLTSSPKKEHIDFFDEHAIPVVFASHSDVDNGRFTCINIDDYQGCYDATQFLIDSGHRKIAMFSGYLKDYDSGLRRYEGYKKALEDNEVPYDENWLFTGGYDIQAGYTHAQKLFRLADIPTAICCASDMIAIGAIRAAEEAGLRVPEDISIMGFDDVPIAEAYRPSLTTVQQPICELGIQSAQMLIQQIQDKENSVKELRILPHKIMVRESCRKLT
jgi:LacI family transcriptional regulator